MDHPDQEAVDDASSNSKTTTKTTSKSSSKSSSKDSSKSSSKNSSSSKTSKSSEKSEKRSEGTSDSRPLKHYGRGNVEEYKYLLEMATQKLLTQQRRTEEAENRARELAALLKQANESRLQAVREAEYRLQRLNEYKTLYEAAQREIYHAQTVLQEVDAQRIAAKTEAAEARTKIRKMNQERRVQNAREEGRQVGLREGLEKARELGLHSGQLLPYELPHPLYHYPYSFKPEDRYSGEYPEEEPSTPRTARFSRPPDPSQPPQPPPQNSSPVSNPPSDPPKPIPPPRTIYQPQFIGQAPIVPPEPPAPAPAPDPVPVPPPQVLRASQQTAEQGSLDQIRPIIVQTLSQPSPRIFPHVPPDGFIPELGKDNLIRLPPPHEFEPVPPTPDRALSPLPVDNQQPLVVPDPGSRFFRPSRAPSSPESNSTTLSQFDIINEPAQRSTPLSVIPEVLSMSTSPLNANGGAAEPHFSWRSSAHPSQQGATVNVGAVPPSHAVPPSQPGPSNNGQYLRAVSHHSQSSTDYTPTESSFQSSQAEAKRAAPAQVAPTPAASAIPPTRYINPFESAGPRYQPFSLGHGPPPSSQAPSRSHSSQHNPGDYPNMSMTTSSGVAVIPDRALFSGAADNSLLSTDTSTSGKHTQGANRQSHRSGLSSTVDAAGVPLPPSIYADTSFSGYPASNAPSHKTRPASRTTNHSHG